jgi:hypothetical protein
MSTIEETVPLLLQPTFTIIPSEIKLRDKFYNALLGSGNYIGEEKMLADSIAGYVELPTIMDNLTDYERKAYKLTVDKQEKNLLRKNQLHRMNIVNMTLSLNLSEGIIQKDDTATIAELEDIYRKVETDKAKYCTWTKGQRLDFVQNVVTPFVIKVCTEFILRYA